jgi:hypothetical protein
MQPACGSSRPNASRKERRINDANTNPTLMKTGRGKS